MKPQKIYADRARALADIIERSPTYNQSTWGFKYHDRHPCGTPACVAGHITAISKPHVAKTMMFFDEDHTVNGMIWLGLDRNNASRMFSGDPHYEDGEDYTPTNADAAAMLRRYADTGKVVWQRCTKSDE